MVMKSEADVSTTRGKRFLFNDYVVNVAGFYRACCCCVGHAYRAVEVP